MKKISALLLAVFMLCVMLCGCGAQQPGTPENKGVSLAGDELGDGLYSLKGLSSIENLRGITVRDGKLLINCAGSGVAVTVCDLENGKLLCSLTSEDIAGMYSAAGISENDFSLTGVELLGGGIAMRSGEKYCLFDYECKPTGEVSLASANSEAYAFGEYIWELGDGGFVRYSADGSSTKIALPGTTWGMPEGVYGDKTLLYYTDDSNSYYASVDKDGGVVSSYPLGEKSCVYSNGALYQTEYGAGTLCRTALDNVGVTLTYTIDSAFSCFIAGDESYAYISAIKDGAMSVVKYSNANGCEADRVEVSDSVTAYMEGAYYINGDELVFGVTDDGTTKFYVWKSGDDSVNAGIESFGDRERYEAEAAVERLESLGKIKVFTGQDVLKHDFPDYIIEPNDDSAKVANALGEIESLLSKMPEGFLDEVCEGFGSFDIYLCGDISPDAAESISTAAGIANVNNGDLALAVDITQPELAKNFAHELMHCIENSIFYKGYDAPGFEGWDSCNPEGFEYFMTYKDEYGNTIDSYYSPEYTPESDSAYSYWTDSTVSDEIYFIDGYSKTFASEDRARVFENLLAAAEPLDWYFSSAALSTKAEFLCQCLRNNFDSLKNCDDIYWERGLAFAQAA